MSSTMKFGLLALISTAAAIPHYGHNRHHHKGGKGTGSVGSPAYPTGGFNGTAAPYPTGAGTGSPEPATSVLDTAYTQTIVATLYETKTGAAVPSNVLPLDVTGPAVCAPETIRVTATEKVTVTVSAAGPPEAPATSELSILTVFPTTIAPFPTSVDYNLPESSVIEPKPSSAASYGKRVPQDWSDPSLYAGVKWDEVNYNEPAPAPNPVPAPEPSPEPQPEPEPASATAPVETKPTDPVETKPTDPAPAPVSKVVSADGASYSGNKRGLAYNDLSLCQSFSGSQMGFAYNWAQAESGSLPDGIQFIPMMHKTSDSSAEAFLSNVDAAVEKGTTAVMTFNEPDHAEQANMSPEAACTAWSSYIEPITSSHPNVEIMSPSVTNGPAPMGLDWLSRFQKNCPGATWHSANIHWYDIYDGQTFDRFKSHIELAISIFNKPIWITEFGLNPGSATPEQATDFLGKALAYLDGNASVKGYAWFMVGTDTSFNMLNSGSATGKLYGSA